MRRALKVVSNDAQDNPILQSRPCPQCNELASWQDNPFRPFCSDRCRTLDLGAWANEEYRVAGDPTVINDDEM